MIIDCDLHVIEPVDLWQSLGITGNRMVGLQGSMIPADLIPDEYNRLPDKFQYTRGIAKHYRDGYENNWDSSSTLRAMDRERIDKALLLPTRGLLAITLPIEFGLIDKMCDAYNNWIKRYASASPDRLLWAGLAAPPGINHADYFEGAAAIVTRPNMLRSGVYWELFHDAELLNIPLVLHEGTSPTQPGIGFERSANRLEAHIMSHPFEAMASVMHLTVGGILSQFTQLRILICEAGSWWRRGFLDRLDDESLGVNGYGLYTEDWRPSTYAKRIWQCGEPLTENSVYGSDYPHGDSKYPRSHALITDIEMKHMAYNAKALLYGAP